MGAQFPNRLRAGFPGPKLEQHTSEPAAGTSCRQTLCSLGVCARQGLVQPGAVWDHQQHGLGPDDGELADERYQPDAARRRVLSGLRHPTATVTSTSAVQHVRVSCTLTVGSNTETRVATIDTTATSGDTTSASLALQAAGLPGTAGVSCQSSVVPR